MIRLLQKLFGKRESADLKRYRKSGYSVQSLYFPRQPEGRFVRLGIQYHPQTGAKETLLLEERTLGIYVQPDFASCASCIIEEGAGI